MFKSTSTTTAVQAKVRKYTNNSGPLVQAAREKFLLDLANDNDRQFYYPEDIEKIRSEDWFVKRFLLARGRKVDDAVAMMFDALKWRKSEDIRNLRPTYFPDEMFKISAMFLYQPDREGNLTVYFRVRYILRIPELLPTLKKFGNLLLYRVDEASAAGHGITGVADFQGTGLQNADIDLLFYSIQTLRNYFPAGINHILIVDLPWVLRACWGLAKSWLPESKRKMVEFITRKEIRQFIDPENLPDFMGGNCQLPYKGSKVAPVGCPSARQFCIDQLGLSEKVADKIAGIYRPIVEALEADVDDKDIIICDKN